MGKSWKRKQANKKKCANTEEGLDEVNIKEKEGMKCRDRIYEVQ